MAGLELEDVWVKTSVALRPGLRGREEPAPAVIARRRLPASRRSTWSDRPDLRRSGPACRHFHQL
ncbi:MAG: hypothetical protein RIR33_70 [Pseudomonadota bacterium]